MKLVRKFTFIISGTLIASLVAIGFLVFTFTSSIVHDTISGEQLELAEQTIDKIDRLLAEKYSEIETIAGDQSVETFLETRGQISGEVAHRLEELAVISGPWYNLELLDTNTNLTFSLSDHPLGKDDLFPEEQEVYEKALRGEAAYSDAFYDDDAGKPSMLFAAPVENDTLPGKPVVGVVMGHLAWPVILEILTSTKGSLVDLYNTHGLEVANKDADYEALLNDDNSDKQIFKNALMSKEGSEVTESIDGEYQSLTSYATEKGFAGYRGNEWILIIETPTKVAFAPAFSSALKTSVFLIPISVIGGLILLLFMIRLLKPVESLTEAATKLAAGDFSKRVPVKSKDEIGVLATAFNTMGSKLQELYTGLEYKVADRTRELTEEEAKLEVLVKALPVGVAVIQASDGKTTLINERGVELLGRGMDPNADLKSASEVYKITKEDGTPYPAEELPPSVALKIGVPAEAHDLYIERPNKTKIILKAVASPMKNTSGIVTSVIVVFDDITKEQEIDKAKTEFVSLASHQLRTPLSTINWYTEMLMAGDAGAINENQKKFLGEIYLGSTRMVELVNALLNVSRLELGTFVIEPEPTDMIALTRSVMDEQKPQLDDRKQKLVPTLDKAVPIMQVDPKLMRMVVQNLLSNAIKYTQEGGSIELSLTLDAEKKNMLLKVSDNGYGITKNQQDKIFIKLFRADNVKAKDTVGTGLGLYIVKSIVEHSDGKIWFESEEDKGTTFSVSIPISGMKKKEGDKALS